MDTRPGLVKTPFGLSAPRHWLARLGTAFVDQIYPPVCPSCSSPVAHANALCATCFTGLRPITAPLCPVYGLPFEVSLGPDARSAEAIADPPPFRRARAAVHYTDIARALVSRLKYGDRTELAQLLGGLMVGAGTEFWKAGPVLLPVPLHATRMLGRKYNQSAELARVIARLTGLAVDPGLARRRRRTRQQVGLTADQRQRNVAGAFAVHPDALARLKGRPVVLIDDVYTTGSTLKALTRALNRAGIDQIDCLTFARVVVGASAPI